MSRNQKNNVNVGKRKLAGSSISLSYSEWWLMNALENGTLSMDDFELVKVE